MKRTFPILGLMLTGCASPGFLGEPSQRVEVSGSQFRVYMQTGTGAVEAHRTSPEFLPSRALTLAKAVRAIEIASGCRVIPGSVAGDEAIIKAEVDCILP